jgi:hypothetical protein
VTQQEQGNIPQSLQRSATTTTSGSSSSLRQRRSLAPEAPGAGPGGGPRGGGAQGPNNPQVRHSAARTARTLLVPPVTRLHRAAAGHKFSVRSVQPDASLSRALAFDVRELDVRKAQSAFRLRDHRARRETRRESRVVRLVRPCTSDRSDHASRRVGLCEKFCTMASPVRSAARRSLKRAPTSSCEDDSRTP